MSDAMTFETWPWALIAIPVIAGCLYAASQYMAHKLNTLFDAEPLEAGPVFLMDEDETWTQMWERYAEDFEVESLDRIWYAPAYGERS